MFRLHLTVGLLTLAPFAHAQQQFVISTAAGNIGIGTKPVPAVTASIGSPTGIAADSAGNIYFTSSIGLADVVLKMDRDGILSRVAGGVQQGFSGDQGPVELALLSARGLAVDGLNNLYIADSNNNRVRKVSPSGIITTVAGNGNSGPSPDGLPATAASLTSPRLLAADAAGNLYIADWATSRIRKVSTDGIISTVAGDGTHGQSGDGGPATSAKIGQVGGMAVDPSGNLYFSDNYYDDVVIDGEDYAIVRLRVRKVSTDGNITAVAGNGYSGFSGDGGSAVDAQLTSPGALTVDGSGNLYIGDSSRVRKVSPDGIISTVAGDGTNRYVTGDVLATIAGAVSAVGLAADPAGNLYIADTTLRIRKLSAAGMIATVAGTGPSVVGLMASPGDGGPAAQAPLSAPTGVAVDRTGTLYIADTFNDRIRRVSPDGSISTIAGKGSAGPIADGGPATEAFLYWPAGLAVDDSGNLYVAAAGDSRIRMISPAGIISTVAGSGLAGRPGFSGDGGMAAGAQLSWPKDVSLDRSGNIYIADTGNNRIRMVSPTGIITTIAGTGETGYSGDGGSALNARLSLPSGLTVDSAGNLYFSDTNNFRVRKISPDGTIMTVAGNGTRGRSGDSGLATKAQLDYPVGLKFDNAGNLYIADGGSVRTVSPSGVITTVAGNGLPGYSGDGGVATSAQLGAWALALDEHGKVYVADAFYNAVRLLAPIP